MFRGLMHNEFHIFPTEEFINFTNEDLLVW